MAPVIAPSARALYRTRQVLHALRPRLDEQRLAEARIRLNDAERGLFDAMQRRDQRHAIEVMSRITASGPAPDALLTAALLHDCGKGEVPVWLRVAKVLAPAAVARWGVADGGGWRGAAYRLNHHAEIGAELARRAGSSETAVTLIGGRAVGEDQELLARLMAADDAS